MNAIIIFLFVSPPPKVLNVVSSPHEVLNVKIIEIHTHSISRGQDCCIWMKMN